MHFGIESHLFQSLAHIGQRRVAAITAIRPANDVDTHICLLSSETRPLVSNAYLTFSVILYLIIRDSNLFRMASSFFT
jgi:hypothetical protein